MIIISSDSTADLNFLFEERNIKTIPLAVILNGQMHQDGIDVNPQKIYDSVEETGSLPKTSARSVEEYKEYFSSIKGEGDEIIHFSISSEISVTCRNAIQAAEEIGLKQFRTGLFLPYNATKWHLPSGRESPETPFQAEEMCNHPLQVSYTAPSYQELPQDRLPAYLCLSHG